ncbi:MAG: BlaI/MecI/CopY family transcriptional regulator [Clostridia bacterium]|nr:BlaI/MecI/CopY family transcriptional regulator [Clostridia bacterium]
MKKKNEKTGSLPAAELDLMRALWELGGPSSATQIHRVLNRMRPCTKPMVYILADRLAAKGFVSIEQVEEPVSYKRITPLVAEEDYAFSETSSLVDKLFHGSWKSLVANIAGSDELTEEDVAEINSILKARKDGQK